MNTSSSVLSFVSIISSAVDAENARLEALEVKAEVANQGLRPTRDAKGRLHAPCAGYAWDDAVYPAGAYLSEDGFKVSGDLKLRIKLTLDDAKVIKSLTTEKDLFVTVGTGKSWNESGVEVCYCYCYLGNLTQKMRTVISEASEAVSKAARDLPKANRGIAPEGKVQVVGTITGMFNRVTELAYQRVITSSMYVTLENGSVVCGTIPKALLEDAEKGKVITFCATFSQKQEDNTTAYFKRPSKAKFV